MNTFENSTSKPAYGTKSGLSTNEQAILRDVKDFFQTDSCIEIIGSMNALIEAFLFSQDLENVTPVMRVNIVNHLRVMTLVSRLSEVNRCI